MRNKRIFIILSVIGLLLALTTTVYATTSAHPAGPNIVGTWKLAIAPSETSPEGLEVLQTFFADGNYLETINIDASTTAHGVWIGSGNTYLYTFHVFTFDEKGAFAGRRIIRGTLRMDGPDHFTGQAKADIITPDGEVIEDAFSVVTEATRMEPELP